MHEAVKESKRIAQLSAEVESPHNEDVELSR